MALCKSTIICENPQIFAVEVHKYFCFLRHSLRPTPDVYNNVLPLDLPTVYCPGLYRRGFKEASRNFYAFDTFFIFTFSKKHLEIFTPSTHFSFSHFQRSILKFFAPSTHFSFSYFSFSHFYSSILKCLCL